MRALVFSDSHGDKYTMLEVCLRAQERWGRIDACLHLGDGSSEFAGMRDFLLGLNPDMLIRGVRGNCDWHPADLPLRDTVNLGGLPVFMTHGHYYGVKTTLYSLDEAAHDASCRIALFGHTHEPLMEMHSVLLINPGSSRDGRFAMLEVHDGAPRIQLLRYEFGAGILP